MRKVAGNNREATPPIGEDKVYSIKASGTSSDIRCCGQSTNFDLIFTVLVLSQNKASTPPNSRFFPSFIHPYAFLTLVCRYAALWPPVSLPTSSSALQTFLICLASPYTPPVKDTLESQTSQL